VRSRGRRSAWDLLSRVRISRGCRAKHRNTASLGLVQRRGPDQGRPRPGARPTRRARGRNGRCDPRRPPAGETPQASIWHRAMWSGRRAARRLVDELSTRGTIGGGVRHGLFLRPGQRRPWPGSAGRPLGDSCSCRWNDGPSRSANTLRPRSLGDAAGRCGGSPGHGYRQLSTTLMAKAQEDPHRIKLKSRWAVPDRGRMPRTKQVPTGRDRGGPRGGTMHDARRILRSEANAPRPPRTCRQLRSAQVAGRPVPRMARRSSLTSLTRRPEVDRTERPGVIRRRQPSGSNVEGDQETGEVVPSVSSCGTRSQLAQLGQCAGDGRHARFDTRLGREGTRSEAAPKEWPRPVPTWRAGIGRRIPR